MHAAVTPPRPKTVQGGFLAILPKPPQLPPLGRVAIAQDGVRRAFGIHAKAAAVAVFGLYFPPGKFPQL